MSKGPSNLYQYVLSYEQEGKPLPVRRHIAQALSVAPRTLGCWLDELLDQKLLEKPGRSWRSLRTPDPQHTHPHDKTSLCDRGNGPSISTLYQYVLSYEQEGKSLPVKRDIAQALCVAPRTLDYWLNDLLDQGLLEKPERSWRSLRTPAPQHTHIHDEIYLCAWGSRPTWGNPTQPIFNHFRLQGNIIVVTAPRDFPDVHIFTGDRLFVETPPKRFHGTMITWDQSAGKSIETIAVDAFTPKLVIGRVLQMIRDV